MIQDFFTGLQFLTRLRLVRQDDWSPAGFGRSVKFFPLVGAVIGLVLAGTGWLGANLLPPHVLGAVLVLAWVMVTGGLHCDGLMDTMDGVFSGRDRERMLEIMKDSRVGANGVVAFVLTYLLKWSLLVDLPVPMLVPALFTAPVAARMAMVMAISAFAYARPDGMGKAFAVYAGRPTQIFAVLSAALLLAPLGWPAVAGGVSAALFALLFGRYVSCRLGGLTGDVYGAVAELSEVVVLVAFAVWAMTMGMESF
ncbi:MAG TPA: adenosylcobinamide-GDP ribazoletransferase [Patescibacteria group bacterium]|nr:adenosylcobinamide-GDP ribazoletransferase [Patescibacteria group bacterium]